MLTCIVYVPDKLSLLSFLYQISHPFFLSAASYHLLSSTPGYCLWFVCAPNYHLLVCVQSCHLLCFCTKLSLVLFLYQAVTSFVSVPSYHLLCFCTMLFVALCLHRAIVCCVFTPTYHLLCFYTKLSLASFLHPTTHHSLDRSRFCSSRPRSPGEWIPFGFCTGLCLASSMIDACLCRSVDVGAHRHSPCCCGQMLLFLSSFILFYSSLLTRVTDLFKQT